MLVGNKFRSQVLKFVIWGSQIIKVFSAAEKNNCSIVNSRSWWWTRRPGVLRSMESQRAGHDSASELNLRLYLGCIHKVYPLIYVCVCVCVYIYIYIYIWFLSYASILSSVEIDIILHCNNYWSLLWRMLFY